MQRMCVGEGFISLWRIYALPLLSFRAEREILFDSGADRVGFLPAACPERSRRVEMTKRAGINQPEADKPATQTADKPRPYIADSGVWFPPFIKGG
jgi:hypothetical protein